jgi:hypothetical protein
VTKTSAIFVQVEDDVDVSWSCLLAGSSSGEGCGLVRGAASPSASARNRSVANYQMNEWTKELNTALDKVDGKSTTRADAPRPRRVVTEPAKIPSSKHLDPLRYADVKPSKGSPYGESMVPSSSRRSETQSRGISPPRVSRRGTEKSHASRFLDRM